MTGRERSVPKPFRLAYVDRDDETHPSEDCAVSVYQARKLARARFAADPQIKRAIIYRTEIVEHYRRQP